MIGGWMCGCLVSDAPLITADVSEHPVPASAYIALESDGSDSGKRFTVTHAGADTIAQGTGGDDPFVLRFRGVGDDLYAAQTTIDDATLYGVVRIDGGRVDVWFSGGDVLTDADRQLLGIPPSDFDYPIPDWAALASAARMIAERKAPDGSLVPAG